jgi:hypothetical protein
MFIIVFLDKHYLQPTQYTTSLMQSRGSNIVHSGESRKSLSAQSAQASFSAGKTTVTQEQVLFQEFAQERALGQALEQAHEALHVAREQHQGFQLAQYEWFYLDQEGTQLSSSIVGVIPLYHSWRGLNAYLIIYQIL